MLVVAVGLSLVAVGVWYLVGLVKYMREERAINALIERSLNEDRPLSLSVLDVVKDSPSMNWAEYSDLVDKVIERRRQMCVDLAAVQPQHRSVLRARVVDMLKKESEFNRIGMNLSIECAITLPTEQQSALGLVGMYLSMAASSPSYADSLDYRTQAASALKDLGAVEDGVRANAASLKGAIDQVIDAEREVRAICRASVCKLPSLYDVRRNEYYDLAAGAVLSIKSDDAEWRGLIDRLGRQR